MRLTTILLLFIGFSLQLTAQNTEPVKPEGKRPGILLIDLIYGMQVPMANLSTEYDFNLNLSSRVSYVLPNNWLFGLSGEYQFSDKVNFDVLAPLRAENGEIIDINGNMAYTALGKRSMVFMAQGGHLLSFSKKNRRHNLEFRLGLGYMQHWYRIRVLSGIDEVPQLAGEYKKGYDRMTSGFALQQYFGYRYLSKSKLINLFIGVDFTEGFTKNRRYWNYDTRVNPDQKRVDVLAGFKLGFTVPVYTFSDDTVSDDLDFY